MNPAITVRDWETLAEAVREELRESAWLLSLLGRQQQAILERDIDAVYGANAELDAQAEVVEQTRAVRLERMDALAGHMSLEPRYSLSALAAKLPASLGPLFLALADEAQGLMHRINRRTRQNQLMLTRAKAMGDEIIEMLHPGSQTRTYNRRGAMVRQSAHRGNVVHTAV